RDLESGNGTFVNSQRIPANTAFKLANNDQIKLGSCLLTFQSTDPLQTKFSDTDSLREVIQKTPNDLLITKAFVGANTAQEIPAVVYRLELEKKERILRLFYDLSHKLGSIFSLEEIYDQVFGILFSVTPASRCFIFRKNEQGEFQQVAARVRGAGEEIGVPLPISQS